MASIGKVYGCGCTYLTSDNRRLHAIGHGRIPASCFLILPSLPLYLDPPLAKKFLKSPCVPSMVTSATNNLAIVNRRNQKRGELQRSLEAKKKNSPIL
ncbi:hypothetical protein VNO77_22037 [Canavalia gladiata]|uniref:Uncharacterized protein n=1 Tax=Canavalia gladiata TaxID=3824 RepID=A0AAN9L2B6_CANGL